ncbi:GIY-YIG nuclease family protein [Methylobacterium sp. WL7]|uniref:GIY-YIG nuclease family protein n=1 Tax=Methylobacterium sp. WL7 TaxID=2603900 RepID=UPI00164F2984|nr:GIY-YIG nuclease family protein [Methylobacterium sp. WL7]
MPERDQVTSDPPEYDDIPEMAALRQTVSALEVKMPPPKAKARLFASAIPEVPEQRRQETALDRAMNPGRTQPRIANKTYIIRCGPFVKIGMAVDVETRFRTLLASNPFDLEMVAILPGGRAVERALHLRFAAYKHRDEWFREEGELAAWIAGGCQEAGG